MKTLFFTFLLLFTVPAYADFTVSTISFSHHFDDKEYNQTHNGLCLEWNDALICHYLNSFNQKTLLLGWEHAAWISWRRIDFGTTIGYLDGYDDQKLWGSVDMHFWYVKLSFAPGELANAPNVLVLGFEYGFD